MSIDGASFISKFPKVKRLGNENVKGLLAPLNEGDEIVVQPKIDGANLTVAPDKDDDYDIVIATRNQAVYRSGVKMNDGFRGAVDHITEQDNIQELCLENDWILRGEFLVRHTLSYAQENYGQFYLYDVQGAETEEFLRPHEWVGEAKKLDVNVVPIWKAYRDGDDPPTVDELDRFLDRDDPWGADYVEGIVVKRFEDGFGWVNKFGRTQWGKLVNEGFQEKNSVEFEGATKYDPPEVRFAAQYATRARVHKIMHKIRDEQGNVEIENMKQILGRTYHDCIEEGIWEFIQDEQHPEVDFGALRELVFDKARSVALDHFNGVDSIHETEA